MKEIMLKDLRTEVPYKHFRIVQIAERKKYVDGVRTDAVDGYSVTVLVPECENKLLTVKVPTLGDVDENAVTATKRIAFDGLEVTPYVMDGFIKISARAKGMHLADKA